MPELSDSWKDDDVITVYTCQSCGHKSLTIPTTCPKCGKEVENA